MVSGQSPLRRLALALALALLVSGLISAPTLAAAETQAQAIKYMDLVGTENGWSVGQVTASNFSRGRRVVVISYLDPQQTRALYDTAVRFMEKSAQPRVVGVIRSPGVPANVTQTEKNPLGFDVFFDGAMLTRNTNPDPRFSRLDHLDANLRSIQRNYFAAQAR